MIVNELSHGFGLKDTAKGATSMYHVIQHIFKHQKDIKVYVFFTFVLGSIILAYLMVRWKRVPWHAIFFIVCVIVGVLDSGNQVNTLGEAWNSEGNFHKALGNLVSKRINEHFKHAEMLIDPYFMINCIVLSMVTILETSISMKLSEAILKRRGKKRLEIVGLAISNFIAGITGLLPLSLPIGRNLLALRSGATSRVYLLIACLFTIIFGWVVWPYMKFLPLITVSIFNASLGILLMDSRLFNNYWLYNPKYAIIFSLIVISCFFVDLVFCMILSWLFFLAFYMQMPSEEAYSIGDINQFENMVISYKAANKDNILNLRKNLGNGILKRDIEDEDDDEIETLVNSNINHDEDLVGKIKSDAVLYILKGRFNFLFYRTHVANLRHIDKKNVVLDFSYVFSNDVEFIQEYFSFIRKLSEENFDLYVTGIPEYRVQKDVFLRGTWVEEFYLKGKMIFIS